MMMRSPFIHCGRIRRPSEGRSEILFKWIHSVRRHGLGESSGSELIRKPQLKPYEKHKTL